MSTLGAADKDNKYIAVRLKNVGTFNLIFKI